MINIQMLCIWPYKVCGDILMNIQLLPIEYVPYNYDKYLQSKKVELLDMHWDIHQIKKYHGRYPMNWHI